jgi:hypothetical protein
MNLTDLGHGLYYVTRTNEPFVLSGPDLPALPAMEESVLHRLLCSAKTFIAGAQNADGARRRGEGRGPIGEPLGADQTPRVGVYYVTVDGTQAFSMTGPDNPGLCDPDLTIVLALVYEAESRLHLKRTALS